MNSVQIDLIRALACGATGASICLVTHLAALASVPVSKRLGLRGLKRERALEQVPLWFLLEPLVRWLGARLNRLIADSWRTGLERKVIRAGDYMGLLPEEVVSLSCISGILGVSVAASITLLGAIGPGILLVGAVAGALLTPLSISNATAERARGVNRRLPYAIDLVSLCMGAGLDFPRALRQVVEKSGSPDDPVVEEFTLILRSLRLGHTRRQALQTFAQRVPIDAVIEFVGAVVQAELRGNPLAEVLRIQAEVSRRKRTVRAEELAARAGAALMGPLVLVFMAVMILVAGPLVLRIQSSGFGDGFK